MYNDADQFLTVCKDLDVVPNIWSLFEWSHIFTPSVMKAKQRFDSVYYLGTLDRKPEILIDNHEMVKMKWMSPTEVINRRLGLEALLHSPQHYECLRLMNLPTIADVQAYGIRRINQGTINNIAVVGKMTDSWVEFFKGDDMFPDIVDPHDFQDHKFHETEEENTRRCANLHRAVHGGPHDKSFYCNVALHCGQLSPQNLYTYNMKQMLDYANYEKF